MLLPTKIAQIAPVSTTLSWTVPVVDKLSKTKLPDQTLSGRLIIKGNYGFQTFPDPLNPGKTMEKRTIFIDLDGTEFGAPANQFNQNDMRGHFVDRIDVQMLVLSDATIAAALNQADPNWAIVQEAPATSNQTGSISSSISFSLDASGGVMGPQGIANAGASVTYSSSHSHTLTDYTYYQRSTASSVYQTVQMTGTKDGTPFKGPQSLVNNGQNPFVGIRLRELPDMATSNVPVLAQAVWMNQSDAGLRPQMSVAILIQPHYTFVTGENIGMLTYNYSVESNPFRHRLDLDFDVLKSM